MLNTFRAIRNDLEHSLYEQDPELSYITVDRMTALVLLDLVEDALDREGVSNGA